MDIFGKLNSGLHNIISAPKNKEVKWWHAGLFFIGVNTIQTLLHPPHKNMRKFYRKQDLPKFAPNASAFGPIWVVNTLFQLWGNVRLLNAKELPHKNKIMALQALSWVDYTTFTKVFFGLKSPVLSAIWTPADALFSISSAALAYKGDKKIFYSLLPISIWTTFASALSTYVVMYNRDEYLGVDPLAK